MNTSLPFRLFLHALLGPVLRAPTLALCFTLSLGAATQSRGVAMPFSCPPKDPSSFAQVVQDALQASDLAQEHGFEFCFVPQRESTFEIAGALAWHNGDAQAESPILEFMVIDRSTPLRRDELVQFAHQLIKFADLPQ